MPRQTPKTPYAAIVFAVLLLVAVMAALFNSPPPHRAILERSVTSVTVQAPPHLFSYEEKMVPEPTPVMPMEPAPMPVVPKVRHPVIAEGGKIALIIDDVGISNQQTVPVFDLPLKPTMSFLPYGAATAKLAARAATEGHEVLLHMPMQPMGHDNPGPNAIIPGLSAEDVAVRLTQALADVPQAVGVNNHMGSAATSDAALMQVFMAALKPTGKFFIDSYTSASSVALQMAKAADVPSLRRDVFLDNDESRPAIEAQIERAEGLVKRNGYVVIIGHPYATTLAALAAWLPTLESRGMKLVTLQELIGEIHDK